MRLPARTSTALGAVAVAVSLTLTAGSVSAGLDAPGPEARAKSARANSWSVADPVGDQKRWQPGWRKFPRLRGLGDLTLVTYSNDPASRKLYIKFRQSKLGAAGSDAYRWGPNASLRTGRMRYLVIYDGEMDSSYMYVYRDGTFVRGKCRNTISHSLSSADKAVILAVPWSCFPGERALTFKATATASVADVRTDKLFSVASDRTSGVSVKVR